MDMDSELGHLRQRSGAGMAARAALSCTALATVSRFLPTPPTSFSAMIGGARLQAIAIAPMRETGPRAPGAMESLRSRRSPAAALRAPVLTRAAVSRHVVVRWPAVRRARPALVHALTGSDDVVLGAPELFRVAASAVVATIV